MREVKLHRAAVKDLRDVHPSYRKKLRARILGLGTAPVPPQSDSMQGPKWKGWYRMKVPPYRIVYVFDDKTVTVWRVFHRQSGYPPAPPSL